MKRALFLLFLLALVAAMPSRLSAQETIKVGYWSSGFSVGFGAVLEAGKFLEKEGLKAEYFRFSDVNGPTKALVTHSIDVAFAAPATGAFALATQGGPVDIILATQIAEATFVVNPNSPLRTLADLKGKKLGMSPAGSATYAIASSVLDHNYNLTRSAYTAVPGNEGPLLRLLQRSDVDAAALRAVTIASVPDMKLRSLGGLVDEWKKMMKTDAAPILAVSIMHKDFLAQHRQAANAYVRAVIAATKFGAAHPGQASAFLAKTANLDAKDATSYVKLWNQIYMASLEPQDVATLKAMAEIFRKEGVIEGKVSDRLYETGPYDDAKRAH